MNLLEIVIFLLLCAVALGWIARRAGVPYPIALVVGGGALGFIPKLPQIEFDPQFLLVLVLPPILYQAALLTSWTDFKAHLRPIGLLAIGLVAVTTLAVGATLKLLVPDVPWAAAFVLGAIVSPPDAVAPLSILRRMQLPRRILVVLEGEGLANDATALILYRFAVAAVSAGVFSFGQAAGTFVAIVVGEILWGIGVGWLMLRLRRWVRNPPVEITLSILTPFLAYWPPEHLGGSGVLATVTAGLYISWNGLRLISAATRLQGIFFWSFFIYLVEGLVFLATGLQARTLMARIEHYPVSELLASAALVSAVVIAARFVWMYPAIYVPRWLSASLRRRDPSPPWQWPFVLAFTGVRGIVSLAAALAIPFATADGSLFPARDLILFLTFSVIVVTLVVQGLMLPFVIRPLGLAHAGRRERHAQRVEEEHARRQAIEAGIARLEQLALERDLPEELLRSLHAHQRERFKHAERSSDGDAAHKKLIELHCDIELLLIETERQHVNDLFRSGKLKDEARRRIERDLDLREAQIENRREEP
jgi:Na+/H+ antiporter